MIMHNLFLRLLLACTALSLMTACSGVEFTPTELVSENLTDGDIQDKTAQESFYPNPADSKPLVDVLFVVDNSASMRDEQLKLGDRLSSFLATLHDVDWQIGITTTDTSDGVHGIKGSLLQMHGTSTYLLTKDTPNFEQVFAQTVVRPEGVNCGSNCPSRVERPLQAAAMAIAKTDTDNRGFFRPGAELAIVFMSDADEGGNGTGSITTPSEVLAASAQHLGLEKRLTSFAIVIEPGNLACLTEQLRFSSFSFYGHNAHNLASITGGVTGSICDANYSGTLSKIGARVLDLVTEIQLTYQPREGSVVIKLSPEDPSVQWNVAGRSVKFNKPPAPGTRVDINYIRAD